MSQEARDSREKVAVLYQVTVPPEINGTWKPVNPGGYADCGADIAFALSSAGVQVALPGPSPSAEEDRDWVFPDTRQGIEAALEAGATVLWLNTVLFSAHPVVPFIEKGIHVVGQLPQLAERYDDKWYTNQFLSMNNIPVPFALMIGEDHARHLPLTSFPMMVKHVRGRGGQGVVLVRNDQELQDVRSHYLNSVVYGTQFYVEEFLPGEELTVTVMPPGVYKVSGNTLQFGKYWCLPAVRRFNHHNGVAPYSVEVAIVNNSEVINNEQQNSPAVKKMYHYCETAAALVQAKAPIRIDCRADENGEYLLFDLNMKPSFTGAGRPLRRDQDSLTVLAARAFGWTYPAFLQNILRQQWHN